MSIVTPEQAGEQMAAIARQLPVGSIIINGGGQNVIRNCRFTQEKTMSSADRELRERLLALAVTNPTGDPVKEATRYFDFVTGKDAKNVRNTVLDALNQAGVD